MCITIADNGFYPTLNPAPSRYQDKTGGLPGRLQRHQDVGRKKVKIKGSGAEMTMATTMTMTMTMTTSTTKDNNNDKDYQDNNAMPFITSTYHYTLWKPGIRAVWIIGFGKE